VSFNLEFYAVAWSDVSAAIGSRNRRLFAKVLKATEPYFEEVFGPEDFEDGPDFELGLERWIDGEVEAPGTDETVGITNLGDALGFVALTRFYGQLVGSLNHSSSAGDLFRNEFLLGVAEKLLRPPGSLELLLSRPIVGYESEDYPFWGGLGRSELRLLDPKLGPDAPMWEASPDIDEWLVGLWNGLKASLEAEKDLITIYA
jgi:hypothetical protein